MRRWSILLGLVMLLQPATAPGGDGAIPSCGGHELHDPDRGGLRRPHRRVPAEPRSNDRRR